jgi:ribosome maturation factor RimP
VKPRGSGLFVGLSTGLYAHFLFLRNVLDHHLEELLMPAVSALGYELLGVERIQNGRRGLLRVYIDQESGISVEDCEKVSHQVSGVLDVEDPIKSAYTLEVSSPGLDRPLFKRAHFEKFIGHDIKVRLSKPLNNRRVFNGTLQNVIDNDIMIMVDGTAYQLTLGNIEKANLVAKF